MAEELSEDQLAELLRSPLDEERPPAPGWIRAVAAFAAVLLIGGVAIAAIAWLRGEPDTTEPAPEATQSDAGIGTDSTSTSPPATDAAAVATTAAPATTVVAVVSGTPTPREYPAAAYLEAEQRTLVFGGQAVSRLAGSPVFDETWALAGDGRWWRIDGEANPGARSGAAMAYDTKHQQALLFGGGAEAMWWCRSLQRCTGSQYGDTWLFDPTAGTWQEATPDISPEPRFGHALVYDSESDLYVLFGGAVGESLGSGSAYGDTWVYDPAANTWTQRHPDPAPPPRAYAVSAYDPITDRVLLWGGKSDQPSDESLWAYDADNDTWESRPVTAGPLPRWGASAAFDSDSNLLILAGGEGIVVREIAEGVTATEVDFFESAWRYDPAADRWEELAPAPSPVLWRPAVYDDAAQRVLVLLPDSRYEYDVAGNAWTEVGPGAH